MRKVALFSSLLVFGLIGSQVGPLVLGSAYGVASLAIRLLTMIGLSFIMIHVGYEFEIDKSNPRKYAWDYVVAATAAGFPWIFCCLYFVFVMIPPDHWWDWPVWRETLLASRFAAPTSAGVLFSMLAAAGLSATWLFQKARVLAIFDDLDTVLFMIPLQMAMIGLRWQLGVTLLVVVVLLWLAWTFLHELKLPVSWPWVMGYAIALAAVVEAVYLGSKAVDSSFPIHLEVLLPAFVLGCVMARPRGADPHSDDAVEGHQDGPESPSEQRVSTIVSACFMCLVGLSMPFFIGPETALPASHDVIPGEHALEHFTKPAGWTVIAIHVIAITVLSNLGKMFATLCYRQEASFRERLALGIGMWPRGEVGGGVLVLSLGYGINGPIMLVAMLSLALNLLLTGVFILIIKRLISAPASGLLAAAEFSA